MKYIRIIRNSFLVQTPCIRLEYELSVQILKEGGQEMDSYSKRIYLTYTATQSYENYKSNLKFNIKYRRLYCVDGRKISKTTRAQIKKIQKKVKKFNISN